jgi:hypothetical protein
VWVFWVNRVFGYFIIYPKYPKPPKYYLFIFCVSLIQSIRITDSISFDYADLPYLLTTLSPNPADFLRIHYRIFSNVRRNLCEHPFSLKINAAYLITQYVSYVVIVAFKPSKTTLLLHVVFIFRACFYTFQFSYCPKATEPLPKECLNTSIDTSKNKNIKNSPHK